MSHNRNGAICLQTSSQNKITIVLRSFRDVGVKVKRFKEGHSDYKPIFREQIESYDNRKT